MSRKKNPNRIKRILGKMWHDEISCIFDTGYMNFKTEEGIEGLAKLSGTTVSFNSIYNKRPGRGAFKRMLEQLQKYADTIHVINIINDDLKAFLIKNGFQESKVQEDGDEPVDGVTWHRVHIGYDLAKGKDQSFRTIWRDGKPVMHLPT